jgi:phosphoenolpyruvate-protein phosphotransferase (PTS system enzyme I)
MATLKGIGLSDGLAYGRLIKIEELDFTKYIRPFSTIEDEIKAFERAIKKTEGQLKLIHLAAQDQMDEQTAEIFHAHMMIANDPEISMAVVNKIRSFQLTAYEAYDQTVTQYIHIFQQLEDDYFKERITDVNDVALRLKKNILQIPIIDLSTIHEPVVIAIRELMPSQLTMINTKYVLGVITEIGGKTSHSSIIARMMALPVVSDIKLKLLDGDFVIVDGIVGEVIQDPDQNDIVTYQNKKKKYDDEKKILSKLIGKKSLTKDGTYIDLSANIGALKDIDYVHKHDADGVGLFRTEFLFLNRKQMPSEDEQYEHYKQVLLQMKNKPVIMRTLDVGGDKILPYLNIPRELNPFLGKRAIRLCFDQPELFKTQLRALLRASVHGNMKIMFPMIATKAEVIKAKEILAQVHQSLIALGQSVNTNIEVGIMIEIPSSALMADEIAPEVDFFSIGTNDLIQYTMAADRMQPDLSYLYQPFNPAILRLISMVTRAASKHNIWVGVCGEMASDLDAIPILLGLGVTELSMLPAQILKARHLISRHTIDDFKNISEKALLCDSEACVLDIIKHYKK